MLTLRQIEVIRAVMVAGSIAGAARLLNVAQPGVSRTMKHLESTLGIRLFVRRGGRYVPSPEALSVFGQFQEVHKKIEDLQYSIDRLRRGGGAELSFGSVPSIANVMVPRAIADVRGRYPDLRIDIDLIKIEDAIDYLMLGRGEFAAMSYRFDHPSIVFEPLATGHLVCAVAPGHQLAGQPVVPAAEIVRWPLIGIDPHDPYGGIMASIFRREGLDYEITIRARFGTTVLALIKQNLGVAVLDIFTVADIDPAGVAIVPIAEDTTFQTYIARRSDVELSSFGEMMIARLRQIMIESTRNSPPLITSCYGTGQKWSLRLRLFCVKTKLVAWNLVPRRQALIREPAGRRTRRRARRLVPASTVGRNRGRGRINDT